MEPSYAWLLTSSKPVDRRRGAEVEIFELQEPPAYSEKVGDHNSIRMSDKNLD